MMDFAFVFPYWHYYVGAGSYLFILTFIILLPQYTKHQPLMYYLISFGFALFIFILFGFILGTGWL